MDNEIIKKVLKDLLVNDKIFLPEWVKKVKIDVGTSSNAPFSEFWLNQDSELCVFGFEPNKYNISDFCSEKSQNHNKLKKNKINKSFFYLNCALSDYIKENENFYCAEFDGGTSSLFQPVDNNIKIKEITNVPVITLKNFFDYFPWDKIEYIEQIKIDAQSSDFNIIKGMGHYLSEKIAYLDVETTTGGQYDNKEDSDELKLYMENSGFICLKWGLDATFFNSKYEKIRHQINYSSLH